MPLPVCAVLDNIRSLYNVGSIFRTADAAGVERLILCGITAAPQPFLGKASLALRKTALGADERVAWEQSRNGVAALARLRLAGYRVAAIETGEGAVDLFDWQPEFPLAVVFGNEVEGVSPAMLDMCDVRVSLPMHGIKRSLNVATAAGVVFYELLRRQRLVVQSPV
ncbi:MAG: RNA methyltransferase [Bryobacterales bacterium]|nr:RNA methyltransferase [Bryobacterales bacterium]